MKAQLWEAKEREESWRQRWGSCTEDGKVLGLQLQAERMGVKDLKTRLEDAESELVSVKVDEERQVSKAFV